MTREARTELMSRPKEKTWLLATLGVVLAAISGIVIWQCWHPLAPQWVLGAIAVPWLGFGVLLRVKIETLGREGKYLDWWSVPHFTVGVLFALVGVGLVYVVAIAIVWEIVEVYARTREYQTNRITDVVLAAAGWLVANLLAAGPFAIL